jgi:hypothetical protein
MKNSEFSAEMKKRIYKLITEILKFVNKVDWRTVCLGVDNCLHKYRRKLYRSYWLCHFEGFFAVFGACLPVIE